MPKRKQLSRRKRPVKKLLDDVLSTRSPPPKIVVRQLVDSDEDNTTTPCQLSKEIGSSTSSSTPLKRVQEEVKKDKGTSSPEPTLLNVPSSTRVELSQKSGQVRDPVSANSNFFYSPIYRHYFGMNPPNPRLFNHRLLEDYIDWYINVYEEEELPWQWIDVKNPAERRRQGEEEAIEEAKKLNSASSMPKTK